MARPAIITALVSRRHFGSPLPILLEIGGAGSGGGMGTWPRLMLGSLNPPAHFFYCYDRGPLVLCD